VVKDSTGELEGRHDTEEEANDQLAALNASEDERDLDVNVDIAYPDRVQNAAEAALDAKDEYDAISDCGTGVGEDRARAIVNESLVPDDFIGGGEHQTAIPSYLDSHSDDLSADGAPTDWGEEEWTDGCGPVQYALWGGVGTGSSLEWAQSTAVEIVEAARQQLAERQEAGGES